MKFLVLNGLTGVGKTLVLKELAQQGQQVLDLEGLACHKGSVFGGDPDSPQPAQKRFESLLYDQLSGFSADRPVYLEAESAKIGKLNLPNPLWQAMRQAKVMEITATLHKRALYLEEDYRDWLDDHSRIITTIDRLQGFHSQAQLMEWKQQVERRDWSSLISSLLAEHYDRRYRGDGYFNPAITQIQIDGHDSDSVAECVAQIMNFGE